MDRTDTEDGNEMDAYREIGRTRARREREAILEAIDRFAAVVDEADVDTEVHLTEAHRTRKGLPQRYRAEFEGMSDALDVDRQLFTLWTFGLADVTDDVVAEPPEQHEGCTNVVVSGDRTDDGRPLLLKNRDISARGLRPQALVEYPPTAGHHGFVTFSTCGQVFVYQGVNEHGLVAANTFVDVKRSDVETEDRLLNGVAVRRILEECASVAEAEAFVSGVPIERMKGHTLALADADGSVLYDVDPLSATASRVADDLIVRTNHYPNDDDEQKRDDDGTKGDSSRTRLARGTELVADFSDDVAVEDLLEFAADHRNGPGPNSICRHPVEGEPMALDQSTTVSASVFRGGTPRVHGTFGNGCGGEPTTCRLGGEHSRDLRSGRHWWDRVVES